MYGPDQAPAIPFAHVCSFSLPPGHAPTLATHYLALELELCGGPIYGFPISGLATSVSLLQTTVQGPPVINGGIFGPEAGLVGLAGIAVAVAIIFGWQHRYQRK